MGKVQGEGDYESARRYRERTKRFMESGGAKAAPKGGVDKQALKKAKSRAKKGEQDSRDARVFRSLAKKK